MIRHIVLWKMAAEDQAARERDVRLHIELLGRMPSVIPEVRALSIGARVAYPGHNWDLGLVADFDDLEGLRAWMESPEHMAAADHLRALSAERSVIDMEV